MARLPQETTFRADLVKRASAHARQGPFFTNFRGNVVLLEQSAAAGPGADAT
jgi:hypothetical protein